MLQTPRLVTLTLTPLGRPNARRNASPFVHESPPMPYWEPCAPTFDLSNVLFGRPQRLEEIGFQGRGPFLADTLLCSRDTTADAPPAADAATAQQASVSSLLTRLPHLPTLPHPPLFAAARSHTISWEMNTE